MVHSFEKLAFDEQFSLDRLAFPQFANVETQFVQSTEDDRVAFVELIVHLNEMMIITVKDDLTTKVTKNSLSAIA